MGFKSLFERTHSFANIQFVINSITYVVDISNQTAILLLVKICFNKAWGVRWSMIPQPLRSQRSALPIKLRTHGDEYRNRTCSTGVRTQCATITPIHLETAPRLELGIR